MKKSVHMDKKYDIIKQKKKNREENIMKEVVAVAKNKYGKEFTREEYIEFMFNKDNEFLCSRCPVNDGNSNSPLPCGQQNCWVTISTN